jgi:hypothetical protein
MEALLEKEGDVENWNDDWLDELTQTMKEGFERVDRRFERVDRRFERVEGEMNHRFDKVDHEFGRVNDKLDKLFYLQLFFLASLAAALIAHAV